jgi:fructose-1,6-bisphosphatase I
MKGGGKMLSKQKKPMTLDRFLVQRQSNQPGASGELTRVMVQLGIVAKIISSQVRRSTLEGLKGLTGETNVQGEEVKKLDKLGNDAFVEAFEYVGIVGALVSEEMEKPMILHSDEGREKYVVLIDPIDGSSNLEVDCMIGSIFSVRKLEDGLEKSVLQEGTKQIAAGYILYGTSVFIIYSAGDGVHGFVLDEEIGEFVLDHEEIRMPDRGKIISANFGNRQKWSPQSRAFSDTLITDGGGGYSLRYSGALVADLHQILHRGGIYFYPEDDKRPTGKLRLLYECAPLAMIAEQAGGGSTTGRDRVMKISPEHIHQRIPFAVGSRYEIKEYEKAYRE